MKPKEKRELGIQHKMRAIGMILLQLILEKRINILDARKVEKVDKLSVGQCR